MSINWFKHPSVQRWKDVFLYGIAGAGLFLILEKNLKYDFSSITKSLSRFDFPVMLSLIIGICCIPLLTLIRKAGFRLAHIKTTIQYPSTLISVFIGLTVYFSIRGQCQTFLKQGFVYWWEENYWIWSCPVAASILISAIYIKKREDPHQEVPINYAEKLEKISTTDFENWVSREEPIDSPGLDFLGHQGVAIRLANELKSRRGICIALTGPFGAGKSSLVELLRKQLGSGFIFVQTSCWGFDKSEKAEEYILKSAISEVNKLVDCMALRGMPSAYIKSVTTNSSWIDYVLGLIYAEADPQSELTKFSPILRAINKQLVLVIEDIDRTGEEFDRSISQQCTTAYDQCEKFRLF